MSLNKTDPQKPMPNPKKSDLGIFIGTWIILLAACTMYAMWPTWSGAERLEASATGQREIIAFIGAGASLAAAFWFSFSFMRARRMNELKTIDALGLLGTMIGCATAVEIGLSAAGVL
ncbi:hypothetical protein [Arthrobacter sp. Helios]|uniref:hypothetical protein n=1 Tax=Arthrobacter sp. Helios TaxID=2828862 RepID=UPI00205CEFB7|nr:hypothetical protein [Arthrobacter sp. Helios]UPO76393.1 hypothetical protein ArtHe_13705 [Arthrobacter sp. Helios]